MATKPGFMMYHKKFRALAKMDAESFKAVLTALCDYSEFGAEPTALNDAETVAFDMMREALDRDGEKYQKRVDAGRKGGIASGEARRTIAKQNEAKRTIAKQNEAKRTIAKQNEANEPTSTSTLTSTLTSTSGNSSNSYRACAREGEEEFPPTVEMVEEYVQEKGLDVDAQEFIDRCEANGWLDGKGRPVVNWKTWLTGYALKAMRPEPGGAARMRPDPRLAALEAMKGGAGG